MGSVIIIYQYRECCTIFRKQSHDGDMTTFFSNIFKKKPKTEEERLFHEFRKTEKRARALSNEIRLWKKSQVNLCKVCTAL